MIRLSLALLAISGAAFLWAADTRQAYALGWLAGIGSMLLVRWYRREAL